MFALLADHAGVEHIAGTAPNEQRGPGCHRAVVAIIFAEPKGFWGLHLWVQPRVQLWGQIRVPPPPLGETAA